MQVTRNIPYIHNYCDRWCERCPFTERCAVFEMNRELPPEAEDPENEAFWNTLSDRFAQSLQMLEEGAAAWGITLEPPTVEEEEAYRRSEAERKRSLDESPLIEAAQAYGVALEKLLTQSPLWERKGTALAQETTLGIKPVQQGLHEVDLLADCRHVLGWYQFFIEVKFRRALGSRFDDDEEESGYQSDANGSAKIALLAVERSRLALTTLLSLVGEDDELLDLLALLERIDREGRLRFPHTDAFVRPGFDDPATI